MPAGSMPAARPSTLAVPPPMVDVAVEIDLPTTPAAGPNAPFATPATARTPSLAVRTAVAFGRGGGWGRGGGAGGAAGGRRYGDGRSRDGRRRNRRSARRRGCCRAHTR